MHYKNGRLVSVGDWVVGPTHNSNHGLRIGRVLRLIERQGSCNVQLLVFPSLLSSESDDYEGPCIIIPWDQKALRIRYEHNDYADCNELIRVDDGWRMVNAITVQGNWDAPCFPLSMG